MRRPARASGRLGAVLVLAGLGILSAGLAARQAASAQTTKAGVFTKAQADAGKTLFEATCATCHAFKPGAKSSDNPDLAGEAFLTRWNQRAVGELLTIVLTTMPNDGSAVLTEEQAVNAVAYVLEQNGFPPGAQALTRSAAPGILIVKPGGHQ